MNKILEFREKRAKAWEGAKAFLDSKRNDKGLLSDEDIKTYEVMEQEVVNLGKEIDRLEKQKILDDELSKPINTPITNKPNEMNQSSMKKDRATDEYKAAMLKALRSNFKQINNVLETGVDTNGGYLVPEEYDSRLIQGLEEENIMRKLSTVITTNGQHKINIAATKPAAAWIEEGANLTFGDATFDQVILDAYKLHVAIKVTDELLYDNAFNLENYILEQFAKALANAEEDAFLNGDGNNKPVGIFNEINGAEVGVTTAGTNISADDIMNLVYSLKRPYRKNAKFITNDQTLLALRKLKDNNGAYIWQPSYQEGEPDRLLGYPVYTSSYAPTITAGVPVIAFGDFKYYNIGDRGTRSFAELKELYAGQGMIGLVAKERVDGKLVLKEAVKLLKMKGTAA